MAKFPITDTASIYHFKRTGNNEEYETDPSYTKVNVSVVPTGTDIQTSFGDVSSFQLFEIFIKDTTIKISNGDKIVVDSTGAEYLVDGMPFIIDSHYLHFIRLLCRQVV